MESSWIFLSYILSDQISGYGDGKRINIEKNKKMNCGDNCNGSLLDLPTHFGTHIDFPFHFDDLGKTGDTYKSDFFISDKVSHIKISPHGNVIGVDELKLLDSVDSDCEYLFVETGFWKKRYEKSYWSENPGFHPETASFIKGRLPNLRLLAFDSISMNPWENRELGRISHKEFLITNDICLVEDVDYSSFQDYKNILQVIVSPLRFEAADGAPCTIHAKVSI